MYKLWFAKGILALVITTQSQASSQNLLLDCTNGTEQSSYAHGKWGSVEVDSEYDVSIADVVVTVDSQTCSLDYGDTVGTFDTIDFGEDKIICGETEKAVNPTTVKKYFESWLITINRYNGGLTFRYEKDYRSNDDYIVKDQSLRRWECRGAKKLL